MDKKIKVDLENIIENATRLKKLEASNDFQWWKQNIVNKLLDGLVTDILAHPGNDTLQKIYTYRGIKEVFESIFKRYQQRAIEAQKELDESKEESS